VHCDRRRCGSRGFGDGCPQGVVEGWRHCSWFWVGDGLLVESSEVGRERRRSLSGEKIGSGGAVVFDLRFLCVQHYTLH
jgi:hypothetical protein